MTYDPKRDLIAEARSLANAGPSGFGYQRPKALLLRLADEFEKTLDEEGER